MKDDLRHYVMLSAAKHRVRARALASLRLFASFRMTGLLAVALFHTGCPEALNSARFCDDPGVGCGPFYLEEIVPVLANCFLANCGDVSETVCFTCPCNTHDGCYDTCGTDKAECDQAFLDEMLAMCSTLDGDCNQGLCSERAFVYVALVALAGDLSFTEGQRGCPEAPKASNAAEILAQIPFEDADFDLIPDHWEIRHGLNPHNPDDAFEDRDNDGRLNMEEFLANTVP